MPRTSNSAAIAGTIFLATTMTSSVLLITDVLFARTWAMVGAGLTAATFVAFSFALGGFARLREGRG